VQGSATREPTPPPTPSGSLTPQQAEASSLCQALYEAVKNPGNSAAWKQQVSSLWDQLADLAGSSRPSRVLGLCYPYVGDLSLDEIPASLRHLLDLGDQGSGSSQVGQDYQGSPFGHL